MSVNGGLEAIGTSFGSMSIDQPHFQIRSPSMLPPLPSNNNRSFNDKDYFLPRTFMNFNCATDNLMYFSNTESESEGEIEKLK